MAEAEQGTKWEAGKKEETCVPKLCTDPEFWGPPRELVSRPSLPLLDSWDSDVGRTEK